MIWIHDSMFRKIISHRLKLPVTICFLGLLVSIHNLTYRTTQRISAYVFHPDMKYFTLSFYSMLNFNREIIQVGSCSSTHQHHNRRLLN